MQDEEYSGGYAAPSKGYRIVKGIFKGVLYGASALVWILVFYVLISTRESKLMDRMRFTSETQSLAEDEDFRLYKLNGAYMSYKARIELGDVFYAKETEGLELSVKYNKQLTDGGEGGVLYVLTDQDGNEYPIVSLETDEIGRYGYARICFDGVVLPIKDTGSGPVETEGDPVRLTISLYRESDGQPLDTRISDDRTQELNDASFCIYDSGDTEKSSFISRVKYDD